MKTLISLLIFLPLILLSQNAKAQSDERKGFIGIVLGPSIPLGEFKNNSLKNENGEILITGYSDSFVNFGYLFNQNLGICASVFYNQYDLDNVSSEMWWMLAGITAGPMFSLPVKDKFFLDLKAKLGFVGATLVIDGYASQFDMGKGLGIDLRASFRYNFSRRWCVLTETGYISSHQKFLDARMLKTNAVILGLGIAYRLK